MCRLYYTCAIGGARVNGEPPLYGAGGHSRHVARHVAATSVRCRCDGAATSLRCRCNVAEGDSRHVAATSLRLCSDVAAMALRRRCDVAPISPLQNMRMRIRIKMPRLARKEAARTSFMMMEESLGSVQGGLPMDQTECLCKIPPACRTL